MYTVNYIHNNHLTYFVSTNFDVSSSEIEITSLLRIVRIDDITFCNSPREARVSVCLRKEHKGLN